MNLDIEQFKVVLKKMEHDALPVEVEAMKIWGASGSPFDSFCSFDDFFKIYSDEKVKELNGKLREAVDDLDFIRKLEIYDYGTDFYKYQTAVRNMVALALEKITARE